MGQKLPNQSLQFLLGFEVWDLASLGVGLGLGLEGGNYLMGRIFW